MKRFTKLVKETNINENNDKSKLNSNKLKYLIEKLINDNINVVVSGASEPHNFNHLKLDGVNNLSQILSDLIIELIENKESKENLSALFEGITYNNNLKDKEKVRLLFRKYKTHDDIISKVKLQASKMNNGEKAYNRAIAATQLIGLKEFNKSTLSEIHDVFIFRSKQLGYRK